MPQLMVAFRRRARTEPWVDAPNGLCATVRAGKLDGGDGRDDFGIFWSWGLAMSTIDYEKNHNRTQRKLGDAVGKKAGECRHRTT